MNAIVLGGILLGDCLRLNTWIEEITGGEEVTGISCPYNYGAVNIFALDTDLPIVENRMLSDFRMEALSWVDFENFCKMFKKSAIFDSFDTIYYPTIEDLHHPLTRIPYRRPKFEIALPDEYICVQPFTHMAEKNIGSIFKVRYPLPVVNIGAPTDMPIGGSQVENGRPLREAAYIISKAKLVVGIDSWAKQFAQQIGVASLSVHFGTWEAQARSIRELGGIDLYRPSTKLLEETINKALEEIDNGSKDLSSLSQI